MMTIQEEERAIAYFQHGLTIAHVRVALTLASIILQGITLIYQLEKGAKKSCFVEIYFSCRLKLGGSLKVISV